jgi:hypothetical protein
MHCPHCGLAVDSGVARCQHCDTELVVRSVPGPFPPAPRPATPVPGWPAKPMGPFARLLFVLLAASTVALVAWLFVPYARLPALGLSLISSVVTLIWFYRARTNAGEMAVIEKR